MKPEKFLRFVPALTLGLSLFSAAMILYFILKYGVDVPYNDQWEYVGFFDHLSLGVLTLEELFRLHNEYRQLFPNLIFVGLGSLTHWNVMYEMLLIFLLACLVSFNIYRLASCTIKGAAWKKWLMFFLANLFIFSPMQWENWLFGVQIEYFLPIACVSSGLVIAFTQLDARLKMFIGILLAIISTYSSVNGFLIWVILYPVFYFSGHKNEYFKKWYAIVLWIAVMAASLVLYYYDYKKPEAHPSLNVAMEHPLDALYYFFGTLGNTLRVIHSLDIIMVVGAAISFIFLVQIVYVLWHAKDKQLMRDAIVWIMLGMYSALTAAMLTVGRLGYGLPQSLASRYTSFTLYVAVAAIFLTAVILHHSAHGKRAGWIQKTAILLLVAFLVFTKVNTYPVAVAELKAYHATILHGKAGLLFINYIPHDECANRIYPSNYEEIRRSANILDQLGYLRPSLIKSEVIEDIEGPESGTADYGSLDELYYIKGDFFMAAGTAVMPQTKGPADAVLLTYENAKGKSILLALDNTDSIRWKKPLSIQRVPGDTVVIRAWAFNATTGKAYRLRNSLSIIK